MEGVICGFVFFWVFISLFFDEKVCVLCVFFKFFEDGCVVFGVVFDIVE